MKYTIISLTITEFITATGTVYICSLYTDFNGKHNFRALTPDEAKVTQWELVRKGAKRKNEPNPYTPKCSTTEVRLMEFS